MHRKFVFICSLIIYPYPIIPRVEPNKCHHASEMGTETLYSHANTDTVHRHIWKRCNNLEQMQ